MDSHLEYFPENLGDYNEEQGERFHQDIKVMQKDLPRNNKKKPLRRSFESKRVRYINNKYVAVLHLKSVVCRTIYKSHVILVLSNQRLEILLIHQ